MNVLLRGLALVCAMSIAGCAAAGGNGNSDWANLAKYRAANAALAAPDAAHPRVVFMGDSITEFWGNAADSIFANRDYINRGISGQTTPQMLLRMRADVIDLKPAVVVILAGTNDIAGNTGPATPEDIEGNIASMAELAQAHGIRVVLASLLPTVHYDWAPQVQPAAKIAAVNRWIEAYAHQHQFGYIDYYTPLADANAAMKHEYSDDGVHPNAAGYRVMKPLAQQAIARALGQRELKIAP